MAGLLASRVFLVRSSAKRILWNASYYTKPKEKKKGSGHAWFLLAGIATSITGSVVYFLGKPEDAIEGLGVEGSVKYANENIIKAYFLRARDSITDFKESFSEPSSDKLLPDLLPPPYQRPYTLVIALNDLLIHTEYDRKVGWKYQKRPGSDALLVSLFDLFEIVVFTDEVAMTGNSIMAALDPNQLVTYRLFRDSTKYIDGQHVKDLSGLNRSLNRVIVVDSNKAAVKFHPENAIILEKWNGDISDRTLWDLIPFLQTIAMHGVDDTRPVLDYYKQQGEDKVLETFKAYQAQLRVEEESMKYQKQTAPKQGVGHISPYFRASISKRTAVDNQHSVTNNEAPRTSEILEVNDESSKSSSKSEQSWTEWIGSWVRWK